MIGPKIVFKKRKSKKHGAHHGGAWKVAYADFVTAMMAFFLVMWILGLSQDTKKAISGYFTAPGLFSFTHGKALPVDLGLASQTRSMIAQTEGDREAQLVAARARLTSAGEQIEDTLEKLGSNDESLRRLLESVTVKVTPEGLRIELVEGENSGFFEVGGAKPNPAAKTILATLAPQLAKMGQPIRIEGHTDRRPFVVRRRDKSYGNWELSADRANAARRLLTEVGGVPASQIDSVAGYADRQLRNTEDPLSISNRRITILVRLKDEAPSNKGGAPPVITMDEMNQAFEAKGKDPKGK